MRKRPSGLVPSGVRRRKLTGPISASAETSTSTVTWLRGGSGPRSMVEGVPLEPRRMSGRSGSSLIRRTRPLMPGSEKKMAEVRARLRPSTVSSTVVPRAMPWGETELSVGGVVRRLAPWAARRARTIPPQTRTECGGSGKRPSGWAALLGGIGYLVEFDVAVEEGGGQGVAVGGEVEALRPVG